MEFEPEPIDASDTSFDSGVFESDQSLDQGPNEESAAPVKRVMMPAAGRTSKFPREDNYYETKDGIGYDEYDSPVWQVRSAEQGKSE